MEVNLSMESDAFFRQYTSQDEIAKYTRRTAGHGIAYLLDHDYKAVYLDAIQRLPVVDAWRLLRRNSDAEPE